MTAKKEPCTAATVQSKKENVQGNTTMNEAKNQVFWQKWADALWQATDDLKCLHAVYMEQGALVLGEVLNAVVSDAAVSREISPLCSDRLEYYGAVLSMFAREYQTVTLDTGNILHRLDAIHKAMTGGAK